MRGHRSTREPGGAAGAAGGARRHRRGERVGSAGPDRPSVPLPADAAEAAGSQGRILLGPHAVAEALRAGRRRVQAVYLAADERGERLRAVARLASAADVPVRPAEPELLDTLAGGRPHQGVAALVGAYPYLTLEDVDRFLAEPHEDALIVVLDQVQDPHNLGAILRSCVAFGADLVVVPDRRAAGVTEAVVRSSAGATELVQLARVPNIAEVLRRCAAAGVEVVGVDPEGSSRLSGAEGIGTPVAVVLGAEGPGLRRLTRELCHRCIRIPIAVGAVASLNVSVAAGIVLHAVRRLTTGLADWS